jgi:acetylornithine deacetylase/succinyl-diaminopimelate desuccinylase-like protein
VSEELDTYIAGHMDGWLEELARLCAVPSVSARHEAVDECAQVVCELLRSRGFQADVLPSDGHPIVVAEAEGANPGRTLLFYNHYDVQPPEPLELWQSPPFEVTRRGEKLFARGVKDDKGELICRLAALDALRAVGGAYPCRIRFLVEGEEEIGSPNLPSFVEQHWDRLQADGAIWEEGGLDPDGYPMISLAARGLLYVELTVETISRDAHSGGANYLPNAAWRLIWALASLKRADERVLIPGFYDAVKAPSPRLEELLARLPSYEESYLREYGLSSLLGGLSGAALTRAVFQPTCNVAGIGAGYQGEGSKTIVPARAFAKIDFRLVPDQDPVDILGKLRNHLDAHGFSDLSVEVLGSERPGVVDPDDPLVALTAETAEEVYDRPARITPMTGGTTPKYLFTERGVPVVAPGLGNGVSNLAHSPNENIRLRDFEMAARHLARLARRFASG